MNIVTALGGCGIAALSIVATPCCTDLPASIAASSFQERLATVRLDVTGMTCGGCAVATRAALRRLAGVKKADVSYDKHSAVVVYDPEKVRLARILQAIQQAGFTAKVVG
ncbi:MAG: heavy-metal-associated domain-containing protein [Gemmatimonadetes bacterium]|nr:heavy-metal-associated domain-containing protein [Gemmatimonadota bacterium]